MKIFRKGRTFRAVFDSGLRHVFLGLVPTSRSPAVGPQLIALPDVPDGTSASIDPQRVRAEVLRAMADFRKSTGVAVHLEAIEYVPNDSPYYEKYYTLAYNLAAEISGTRFGEE